MKKILLFISLLALVGMFTGCDNDDDDKFFADPELLGTWQFMSMSMKIGGEETEITDFQEIISFSMDGKYESVFQQIEINEETGEPEVHTVTHSGRYERSGSSLTLTYTDEDGNTITKGPGSLGYYEDYGTIVYIQSQLYLVRNNMLTISGIVEMDVEGITIPVTIRTTYKRIY